MKELYQIAAEACSQVYQDNIDLGTTEFQSAVKYYKGNPIQVVSIAGSNEKKDWLKNLNPLSTNGIKKVSVDAAAEINSMLYRIRKLPLLVCGHSKAGATAIAFKKLFGADWCIAFAPARSLRYWTDRRMKNTTIFTDPDDPVSKVGMILFGHPICTTVKAKNDHIGLSVKDHGIHNWVNFVA